jgi:hypothetical protein
MAVAVAAVVAAPSAAFADEPPSGIVLDRVWIATGVKIYIEEYGDTISVPDASANGHADKADVFEALDEYYLYSL